jgi:hypothetical protein
MDSFGSRWGPEEGYYKHGNDISIAIKVREFIGLLSDDWIRKDCDAFS